MSEMARETDELFNDDRFRIENDSSAEWAMKKIAEKQAEKDRWKAYYKEALKKIEDECDADIAYFNGLLNEYFQSVPHRSTKTQEVYDLASGFGKLILKLPSVDYEKDEAALLQWAKESDLHEFIKVEESVRWADLKKTLVMHEDGAYCKETGEKVAGVKLVEKPQSFTIQIKGGMKNG